MKLLFWSVFLLIEAMAYCAAPAFPLLGLWQVESAEIEGQKPKIFDGTGKGGGGEYLFRPDGTLVTTVRDPEIADGKLMRLTFKYTFQPPDVFVFTFDGSTFERQRFTIEKDRVYLTHLDYKVKQTLRRIEKSSFKDTPEDLKTIPRRDPPGNVPKRAPSE